MFSELLLVSTDLSRIKETMQIKRLSSTRIIREKVSPFPSKLYLCFGMIYQYFLENVTRAKTDVT